MTQKQDYEEIMSGGLPDADGEVSSEHDDFYIGSDLSGYTPQDEYDPEQDHRLGPVMEERHRLDSTDKTAFDAILDANMKKEI